MNKKERRTYEELVIKSLESGEKDFTCLVEDVYVGWRYFNMRKNKRNPYRPFKLIKQELSTDILIHMIKNEKIDFNNGFYKLPGNFNE